MRLGFRPNWFIFHLMKLATCQLYPKNLKYLSISLSGHRTINYGTTKSKRNSHLWRGRKFRWFYFMCPISFSDFSQSSICHNNLPTYSEEELKGEFLCDICCHGSSSVSKNIHATLREGVLMKQFLLLRLIPCWAWSNAHKILVKCVEWRRENISHFHFTKFSKQ